MNSSTSPYRKKTVLIVTNNERTRQELTLLLTRLSYEISPAGDPQRALEVLNARQPDCLISEFMLPGMSGLELFRNVQRIRPGVPVMFLVPGSDAAAESQCLGYGAAGCITKPLQAEQLYAALQAAVEPHPRCCLRIEATLPVTVNNNPVKGEAGCLVDLSEQGMYLPLRESPRGPVAVRLQISDRTIATQAAVLYSHATASGGHREPGVGLRFLSLTPQDREFLRRYIRDEVTKGL